MGGAARAAEPRDESQRWVPAFGVYFDFLGQKAEGSVTTSPVLGPPLDPFDTEQDAVAPGTGCLRGRGTFFPSRDGVLCATARPGFTQVLPNDTGNDTSISPMVGGSLELMTPSLLGEALLRPRLFAHVDGAYAFSYERNLAGTESPGEFELPRDISEFANNLEELEIRGQGSRTRMQLKPFVLSAGGGIAFSLDVMDRRIRIKPSIEYLRQEVEFIGVVHRAVKLEVPSGVADLSRFRLISLTSFEEKWYDGVGPGLELEADAARLGPFVSSVYLMGRGYYLFGDFDIVMTESNQFGESATWTASPERWVWRTGVGFRIRWVPGTD